MADTKRCTKCDQEKPLDDFPRRASAPDGRRGQCKTCVRVYWKEWNDKAAVLDLEKPRTPFPSMAIWDQVWAGEDATVVGDVVVTGSVTEQFDLSDAEAERAAKAAAKLARQLSERDARRNSDFEPMRPEDIDDEYATGVANDDSAGARLLSSEAAREKRQEFNRNMGEFATDLRDAVAKSAADGTSIGENLPPKHAPYITALAEGERRHGNRRWSRSIAIAEGHEQLSREAMMYIAQRYFSDKIEPTGYAKLPSRATPARRTACVLLSDLHLGSELDSIDEPVSFKAVEEARRLEYVLRQFIDFKPQYRDVTEALIIINGDIIEGALMHDLRSGAPLAEQKAIFWKYFQTFIAMVSQQFPSVRIVCQPGNHGRDLVRHPGRATTRKWDGHEWEMYYSLSMMCSGLKNVRWSIPFRAVSIIDLYGSKLGATHADTEVKLGDPDTKSNDNARILDRINSVGIYRDRAGMPVHFDAWVFGHYHKARYQPRNPRVLWNAALVPPNGYARTAGYIGEPCGQWIWEAVEGHPIGDTRFIEVGLSQDHDEQLGTIIKPFRFDDQALETIFFDVAS